MGHEKAVVFIHDPYTSLRFPTPQYQQAERTASGPGELTPQQMAGPAFKIMTDFMCLATFDQIESQIGNGGMR